MKETRHKQNTKPNNIQLNDNSIFEQWNNVDKFIIARDLYVKYIGSGDIDG